MRVIPARADDVPTIIDIQKACGLSAWTPAGYSAEIGRENSILLVCVDTDRRILGFIVGRVLPFVDANGKREAEIYNIGTLVDFRGTGVGSSLLTRFIELCKDRNVARIWLEVRTSNSTAKSFYRRHRFVRHSKRTAFYSDPVEDADVMYLSL